jgi:hypothetical protein
LLDALSNLLVQALAYDGIKCHSIYIHFRG